MTFLEAAIEVLKREGKPLELRRLAELAVRHNLLSVVGRDPEDFPGRTDRDERRTCPVRA